MTASERIAALERERDEWRVQFQKQLAECTELRRQIDVLRAVIERREHGLAKAVGTR